MMRPVRIQIACPAPRGTLYGNRISALRWARILKQLGHKVAIRTGYEGESCDLLLALHAKRSAPAIFAFHERYPERPALLALTGTDVYRDIHQSHAAQQALQIATRLITLQPLAGDELAADLRSKVRVIYQSVEPIRQKMVKADPVFRVCVIGHLRAVKDPFRAAMAVRALSPQSTIELVQAGAALDSRMEHRARAEMKRNPRYRWLGEIPRPKVRRLIASSRLMVLSSRMEGGANVISEAIVGRTPVVASRIPGSTGLLGPDYPGFYPVGDTRALRKLLLRAETDAAFYRELRSRCARLAPLFRPARERSAWRKLLQEL